MSKIVFLADKDYYGQKISEQGINVVPPFRTINTIFKFFRILHLNSKLGFKNFWYTNLNNINSFDIVILPATEFSVSLASYIESKVDFKRVRLIYWFWNPVKPKYAPQLISSKWEKWTFDKEDSVKYKMKYNGTYFFNIPQRKEKEVFDVFFIGLDKGRYNELLQLKERFLNLGLKSDFHIVSDKKQIVKENKYSPRISYADVLDKVYQSKAILEIMQENQTGLTLRTMESLFFSKKIITNNKTLSTYNFYRKENTFILGVDDFASLKTFIDSPYMPLDPSLIVQYDFSKWKERLIKNVELQDDL